LLLLDAPRFDLIGASISIIGALGEHHGILVYESLASYEAFSRQAEQFGQSQPRRSELRTPALSVTFSDPTRLPPEMVREVGQYGWELAGLSAYPVVMAFDPDNVARPLSERDCELAAACCLAVGRLVARLATGSRLDPASARETVVVETLPGQPTVTVAPFPCSTSLARGAPMTPPCRAETGKGLHASGRSDLVPQHGQNRQDR